MSTKTNKATQLPGIIILASVVFAAIIGFVFVVNGQSFGGVTIENVETLNVGGDTGNLGAFISSGTNFTDVQTSYLALVEAKI